MELGMVESLMDKTLRYDRIPIERGWGISMLLHEALGHTEPWEICEEGCDNLADECIRLLFGKHPEPHVKWATEMDRALAASDKLLYGNAFIVVGDDGLSRRLNPATVEPVDDPPPPPGPAPENLGLPETRGGWLSK